MKSKTGFWAVCLLVLLGVHQGYTQIVAGGPGAFLRSGVGVRALGLGGAFSAIADDPSAGFWNPAGLAQLNELQLQFSVYHLSRDRRQSYISVAAPFGLRGSLGLSWVGFQVSGIEARSANTPDPDFVFRNSNHLFLFTFAYRIFSGVYLGGNFKMLYQTLHQVTALSTGLDAGVLLFPLNYLRLAVVLRDVRHSLQWSNGRKERVPTSLRIAAALHLTSNFLLSADLHKTASRNFSLSVGTEYVALNRLPIRIGYLDHTVVAGGGLDVYLRTFDLRLDYAYGKDFLDGGDVHKIAIGLSFFRPHAQ